MADLVTPEDLAEFPGAPFTAALLRSAEATLRGLCRWHIAPSQEDTVLLDSDGGPDLFLPSLFVTAEPVCVYVGGGAPVPLTDVTWKPNGVLHRACGFPRGMQVIQVTFTHGHEECPPELFPVLAEIARDHRSSTGKVRSKSLGSGSISYDTSDDSTVEGNLPPSAARYRIPVI